MQQQDPAAEVTYAVEILNRNARGAGLSNRVQVPAVVTLPPPSDLAAQLTGDGTVLTWTSTGGPQNIPATPSTNSPEFNFAIESIGATKAPAKMRLPVRFRGPSLERHISPTQASNGKRPTSIASLP